MTSSNVLSFETGKDIRDIKRMDVMYDVTEAIITAMLDSGALSEADAEAEYAKLDQQRLEAAQLCQVRKEALHV